MVKRKRNDAGENGIKKSKVSTDVGPTPPPTFIQIVTGSYERTLHGIVAEIPQTAFSNNIIPSSKESLESTKTSSTFSDTFLFNAHASAVRCLALSPPSDATESNHGPPKRILASGSTDERINLYHLSTAPPPSAANSSKTRPAPPSLPSLTGTPISQNPRNRELGSLLHHSGTVTVLHFPSRSKFLSSATDNTIAISRTRDWTVLSSIKAPIPKPHGRPSGDTLAPGEVPSGVNDFAVHPSNKLMVSVGRAERCMRLWNLVTGKKAGVLQFDRPLLESVQEGKYATGEGRRVVWDEAGEEFVVGFERGAVVFGIDCKPRARILPSPRTKLHQIHYLPASASGTAGNIVTASTEDGRILFYSTSSTRENFADTEKRGSTTIPLCALLGTIGGLDIGLAGRVKDFEILKIPSTNDDRIVIISGSSDGAVRLWLVDTSKLSGESVGHAQQSINEIAKSKSIKAPKESTDDAEKEIMDTKASSKQVGILLGTCETGNRIMCLKAFELTGEPETVDSMNIVPGSEDLVAASSAADDDDDDDDSDSDV